MKPCSVFEWFEATLWLEPSLRSSNWPWTPHCSASSAVRTGLGRGRRQAELQKTIHNIFKNVQTCSKIQSLAALKELKIAELGDEGFVPSQLEPWLDKLLGMSS